MRESSLTSEGSVGVDPKPNRTGGATGRSSPSSAPSNRALTDLIRCRSIAEYHSRWPPPALPLVRTPSMVIRAIGSCTIVHHRALANPRAREPLELTLTRWRTIPSDDPQMLDAITASLKNLPASPK